jgi:two-component system NtrC family sensor kinase
MAHEKVLIIDDRRENVVFLADQILRPDGYQVITAGDGEAGLEKALSEHPDLIVMDIRMPKMTGIDVLQALKDAGQEIPVIVTTFHGSEELAIQAFRLGARDYLIKPYEVEEMVVAIDRILAAPRRFRQERQVLEEDMARTSKQLERRVKELHILSGIGKAVTSLHKVETILQRIVEAATYLTGAEEAFLMLVDEDSGDLHMRAVQGMGKKYQRFRQKVDDSIAGQVVRTGRAVRIGQSRSQGTHEVMTGYLVRDLLNVPLKVREKVIGVLGVDNLRSQGGFTENDEYLLSALADYAAIAIDNARLYELMEERTKKLARMVTSQAESRREQDQAQIERLRAREQRFTEERAKIAQIAERLSHLCIQLQGVGMRLDGTPEPGEDEG